MNQNKKKKADEKKKVDDKQKKEEPKEVKESKESKPKSDDNKDKNNKDKKDATKPATDEKKDAKTTTTTKDKDKKDEKEKEKKEEPKAPPQKTVEELENEKTPAYTVGDEVVLTKDRMGVIRYKGRVAELGPGIYYGVELTDSSVGHNDGQVKGVRYFKTEGQRAMFIGYEKIRRKMTKRDHKRIDSLHAVASNVTDLQKKYKEGGEVIPSVQESSAAPGPSQDDEKDPILSPKEAQRQREESLTQQDNANNNNDNYHHNNEHKEAVSAHGLQAALNTDNLLQFIMRQNDKYRNVLFDTFANPQTHVIIVEAFKALKEMESEEQSYAWSQLISRWQKYL